MKKIIVFIITIAMLALVFTGCSDNGNSAEVEEKLRAEIKAEMEAEQAAEKAAKEAENKAAEQQQESNNQQSVQTEVEQTQTSSLPGKTSDQTQPSSLPGKSNEQPSSPEAPPVSTQEQAPAVVNQPQTNNQQATDTPSEDKPEASMSLEDAIVIFFRYCYENDPLPKDIKNTYFYQHTDDEDLGDSYKRAVDTILANGKYIVWVDDNDRGYGKYVLSDTETVVEQPKTDVTEETSSDYDTETLYSLDEEKVIDYSKYELVIIPMQESANELDELNFEFANENVSTFTVSIFGHLKDVTLKNIKNGMDSDEVPSELYVGEVYYKKLNIKALMPTDFSSVRVEGTFIDGEGGSHLIEFTLDDMREATSYEIITK